MSSLNTRRLCVAIIAILFFSGSLTYSATYYVDATDGDDAASGTSEANAWQTLSKVTATTFSAGDFIKFQCGESWSGLLWPKGSGSDGSPIKITCYGDPNDGYPLLNGNGIKATVKLYNQEYWEICDLEITNYLVDTTTTKRGVMIWVDDADLPADVNQIDHIYMQNLEIHDVNGSPTVINYGSGIYMVIEGDGTAANKVWFNDVEISDCYIHDVINNAFINYSDFDGGPRTNSEESAWGAWTNVVIKNNTFEKCSGRAVHTRVMDGAVIEYNLAIGNNYVEGEGEEGSCFVIFNCDNNILQYNEVYDTAKYGSEPDGAAFDIDYRTKSNICQYNYDHENGMSYAAPCNGVGTGFSEDNIFRYNISEDAIKEVIHQSGATSNLQFYNNTMYIGPARSGVKIIEHKSWNGWGDGTKYYNNIFYNAGTSSTYSLGSSTNNTFDYNVFYGGGSGVPSGSDSHVLTSDPKFTRAGTGGIGLDSVDGYKLQADSPCIDSGKTISGNGGLDYWGNTVPYNSTATDRGAHEHSGDSPTLILPEADSFIRGGSYANTNYGTATTLDIKTASDSVTREIYLRFDLSDVKTTVTSAWLRMRASNDAPDATHTVSYVSDDTWTETGITWNNAPSAGATLDSDVMPDVGDWTEFDVTSQVATELSGNDKISLMVNQTTGDDYGQYNSSEVTTWQYKPHLLIITPPTVSTDLSASADSYVRGGSYADDNYGTDTTMAVKNNRNDKFVRRDFIKFDLSGVTGTVASATLKLYVDRRDASTTHGCDFVSTDSWTETGITWNNQPSSGTTLDSLSVPSAGNWIEFDVTDQVTTEAAGDDTITLMIHEPTATTYTLYRSRDHGTSSTRPKLTITTY